MGGFTEELVDFESAGGGFVGGDFTVPADVNDREVFGFMEGEFKLLAGADASEALFGEKMQLSSPDSLDEEWDEVRHKMKFAYPSDLLHSLADAPRAIDIASKMIVDIWEDGLKR